MGRLFSMPWGQEDSKDLMPWHHVPISSSFLQLEVLTNLANETNISTILREFQVCHGHTDVTVVPPCHGSGCQNTTTEGMEESPTRSRLRPCQPHGWLQTAPTHGGGMGVTCRVSPPCLCRHTSAAWTRTLWQPPFKPSGAVPPTLGRCGTPASMVWSSSSPTGMVSARVGDKMGTPSFSGQHPTKDGPLPAELVVAESVVVIKKLLQMQPAQHSEIIKHMAKLTDNIQVGWDVVWPRGPGRWQRCHVPEGVLQVPMARASILWLIGEYCEHVPKIAPDVLRKMAKTFTNEEDIVKLQVINLAAKLYLTNSKQVPGMWLNGVPQFPYRGRGGG